MWPAFWQQIIYLWDQNPSELIVVLQKSILWLYSSDRLGYCNRAGGFQVLHRFLYTGSVLPWWHCLILLGLGVMTLGRSALPGCLLNAATHLIIHISRLVALSVTTRTHSSCHVHLSSPLVTCLVLYQLSFTTAYSVCVHTTINPLSLSTLSTQVYFPLFISLSFSTAALLSTCHSCSS